MSSARQLAGGRVHGTQIIERMDGCEALQWHLCACAPLASLARALGRPRSGAAAKCCCQHPAAM